VTIVNGGGYWIPAFAGMTTRKRGDVLLWPECEEASGIEREVLWGRVQSEFLALNEKRATVEYGAVERGDALEPPP
jgi:hypothetical protein